MAKCVPENVKVVCPHEMPKKLIDAARSDEHFSGALVSAGATKELHRTLR